MVLQAVGWNTLLVSTVQLDRLCSTGAEPWQLLHAALLQAMTSPSGTLSTIASGTTVSVAESPVGGLSHGPGAFQAEPAQQQVGSAAEMGCKCSSNAQPGCHGVSPHQAVSVLAATLPGDLLQGGAERPSLADGVAPGGPTGLQVSPMLTPAAAQGARRALMAGGDAQAVPLLTAARDWRATDAAADQQERLLFR